MPLSKKISDEELSDKIMPRCTDIYKNSRALELALDRLDEHGRYPARTNLLNVIQGRNEIINEQTGESIAAVDLVFETVLDIAKAVGWKKTEKDDELLKFNERDVLQFPSRTTAEDVRRETGNMEKDRSAARNQLLPLRRAINSFVNTLAINGVDVKAFGAIGFHGVRANPR